MLHSLGKTGATTMNHNDRYCAVGSLCTSLQNLNSFSRLFLGDINVCVLKILAVIVLLACGCWYRYLCFVWYSELVQGSHLLCLWSNGVANSLGTNSNNTESPDAVLLQVHGIRAQFIELHCWWQLFELVYWNFLGFMFSAYQNVLVVFPNQLPLICGVFNGLINCG